MARIVAGTGSVTAVTIDDLIDNYSKFTTTGVASRIVQTGADGSIDTQKLKLDNYEILDPTNSTMTMKTSVVLQYSIQLDQFLVILQQPSQGQYR